MNRTAIPAVIVVFIVLLLTGGGIMTGRNNVFAGSGVRAPDFPSGAEWINTSHPLTMKSLKGHVVLLDFWTYCCINCMHVLPDLARLEDKFGDRLIVIGVHSAKFEGERDTGNIRDAVRRYGIRHPVVNDVGFVMWRALGVRAWPTLVLINWDGYIVGSVSGERNYDVLDRAIGDLIGSGGTATDLAPLPVAKPEFTPRDTELFYPGKVLAAPGSETIYIADSGNNRIVIANNTSGDIIDSVGSGSPGLRDGSYREASFRNPQGMALDGSLLYVVDTDNHALRRIDLEKRMVETVTGDGGQSRWGARGGTAGPARLNSPWDLVVFESNLYIAMAGSHQLWMYDPATDRIGVFAGTGREDIGDGRFDEAFLAQPSGIATDGYNLYFADSETSSIRMADMANGRITTLTGTGLFDFGFRDGALKNALLQHPLGVAWGDGYLWIADTYNNRIRRIDTASSVIETIAGKTGDGLLDGIGSQVLFDEPGGLSYQDGKLFIADTNNHAIRVLDTATESVRTLDIRRFASLPQNDRTLNIIVEAPECYHMTENAPVTLHAVLSDGKELLASPLTVSLDTVAAGFEVPHGLEGTILRITGEVYLCDDGDKGSCYLRSLEETVRVRETRTGGKAELSFRVTPPERRETFPSK